MKRTSAILGERLENIGYALIGTALLASTALAFVGAPMAVALPTPVVGVQLEGLVVTPSRTYRASEWAQRPAASPRIARADTPARAKACAAPKRREMATQLC